MNDEDYPALYRASDKAAEETQSSYLFWIRTYSSVMIAGAALSLYGIDSTMSAVIAAILFLGGMSISILLANQRYENRWYRTRAVAESVKTSTWRFMMKAPPYDQTTSINEAEALFIDRLREILDEHRQLGEELAGGLASEEQITNLMRESHQKPLIDRKQLYLTDRIEEQREWYSRKSSINKNDGKRWFKRMVGLQIAAVVLILFRIAYPNGYWPVEVFVVAAGGAHTWLQVKRYRELASVYGLTAHEIGLIRPKLDSITRESEFSDYVKDAENAFSREHTQWVARSDLRSP